ncbi:hypothetical protein COU61_05150 [Candidatus Pacearchaeota archaeon CG10_big_fil_rev_8_21_14_0_10_35_13]|nr:MAG: hypothetical protein COU61_05150 [Candidatus Pacearchaeota archaeon CG10_big_fil_rev_8_21_14_0_10_35_13]
MFLLAQLIGLFVTYNYSVVGKVLPYGMEPPAIDAAPGLTSIVISFAIAIAVIFLLMKIKAAFILRTWFFLVVALAVGITLTLLLSFFGIPNTSFIAFIIALVLAYFKTFRRGMIIHNLTELLIYPGIAAVFVPILNLWTLIVLLILISVYDMYAVWHSGFMQKMANYQIKELKFFAGFFVPYFGKKERDKIKKLKQIKKVKGKLTKKEMNKKFKVNLAILGGGDVVFPIIASGVVMVAWGLLSALMVPIGATIALGLLLYYSEKGKFYPAMPFISAGIFLGMIVGWLL